MEFDFVCDACLTLFENFTKAEYNLKTCVKSGTGSLVNCGVCFAEILSSFGVTDDKRILRRIR